jgi:hypothetical protein
MRANGPEGEAINQFRQVNQSIQHKQSVRHKQSIQTYIEHVNENTENAGHRSTGMSPTHQTEMNNKHIIEKYTIHTYT